MKFLSFSILFILVAISFTTKALVQPIVTTGAFHTCLLDYDGVRCWGFNREKQLDVPRLVNPRLISAGAFFTCALDDIGVSCWGETKKIGSSIPMLKNVKSISAGYDHVCALDELGVKCWGNNDEGELNVPQLIKPKFISAGSHLSCAIDETGLKCWGKNFTGNSIFPNVISPHFVELDANIGCIISNAGLNCWGNKYAPIVPKNIYPEIVTLGSYHFCLLLNGDVQCSSNSRDIEFKIPHLVNPYALSSGHSHTCAMDVEGLKCWGDNSKGQAVTSTYVDYRTKDASLIPIRSNFQFNKDIVIEPKKNTVKIGNKINSLNECTLVVEPNPLKERVIKAGRKFVISEVLVQEVGLEKEISFTLEDAPVSILCFSSYADSITVGDLRKSLEYSGIVVDILKIEDPEEI